MPLDGRRIDRACGAAEVLRIVSEKFKTREWRWIQGCGRDRRGGYCLMGAVIKAARNRSLDNPTVDQAALYLATAIGKLLNAKPRWTDRHLVAHFNDTQPFEVVMDVISIAMHMADTDAGSLNEAI